MATHDSELVRQLVADGWSVIAGAGNGNDGPILLRGHTMAAQISTEGSVCLLCHSDTGPEWMAEFGPETPDRVVLAAIEGATNEPHNERVTVEEQGTW